MYSIRVDTGGTFTDCWGLADGSASPRLVKVLSSGRLRVAAPRWISDTSAQLTIPPSWEVGDSFFTGYKIESGGETALVLSFEAATGRVMLSRPIPEADSVDLFTREEAPVLGARLLTGTALDEEFPLLHFRLATTRGTNALLERKGARLAFFTTHGFRDLLTIRDQRRPDLFALEHQRPPSLYESVVEVTERLDAEGKILTPLVLDEDLKEQAIACLASGVTVAAIGLLHSYRNPAHEEQLRECLLDLGFTHVSTSAELAPLIKILPRAETAVANAYLHPVMQSFLDHVRSRIGDESSLLTMTSAGGLETQESYAPKDSLLSGPAGGVSGAAAVAAELNRERILTFDMGGTSTDVARYDHGFQYRFEQIVGDARLLSPALKIETVAAGGGSICHWSNGTLQVGPESAGASPGPACYGRGGPLTLTDVNLLLGRIDPDNFGIPISEHNRRAAESAARELQAEAGLDSETVNFDFLHGLVEIAVEQMADAIRTISVEDGADPSAYTLLAFGGAGPLHACQIADRLGISEIIIPAEAGLLSAYGLDQASLERFSERQVDCSTDDPQLANVLEEVERRSLTLLQEIGAEGTITRRLAEMRLSGQDATLSVDVHQGDELPLHFRRQYEETFGYPPPADRSIEVVSYRAIAGTGRKAPRPCQSTRSGREPNPVVSTAQDPFFDRETLDPKMAIAGPVVIQDPFSTLFLPSNWIAVPQENGALLLQSNSEEQATSEASRPAQVEHELFRHRFDNLVEEMGTLLQRSAVSTNVKERADFSCALLDGEGYLITSAPHIPVHLGALGLCVRMVSEKVSFSPGDTIVTNHPGVGGSHLPDVTLITPIFGASTEAPVAFVANRAHHAEIGGLTPGSMPPHARSLEEEGVVLSPTHLIRAGESCFDEVGARLSNAPFPTRNLRDNLADLHAQLASNRRGTELFTELLSQHGEEKILSEMKWLKTLSEEALTEHLQHSGFASGKAVERLDDGTEIHVSIENSAGILSLDFAGTTTSHPANLHATPAIVQSAILYVLRLWTQTSVPLNEGMLSSVRISLPRCFLNPEFLEGAGDCPAVVGGNVETSQRLVDTLIRALEIQSCSQGTMNNFLFGDETFGYYETIAGGSGAGEGYEGTSGIHTHMTNTAITDPEIMEHRYPIRLHRFAIREGSGGKGKWRGGDGVVREIEFLHPLQISLLTQHRIETPFGLKGGDDGSTGSQSLNGRSLPGIHSQAVVEGDRLLIETPGGGGFGKSGAGS